MGPGGLYILGRYIANDDPTFLIGQIQGTPTSGTAQPSAAAGGPSTQRTAHARRVKTRPAFFQSRSGVQTHKQNIRAALRRSKQHWQQRKSPWREPKRKRRKNGHPRWTAPNSPLVKHARQRRRTEQRFSASYKKLSRPRKPTPSELTALASKVCER
jgi:hypothetical protein